MAARRTLRAQERLASQVMTSVRVCLNSTKATQDSSAPCGAQISVAFHIVRASFRSAHSSARRTGKTTQLSDGDLADSSPMSSQTCVYFCDVVEIVTSAFRSSAASVELALASETNALRTSTCSAIEALSALTERGPLRERVTPATITTTAIPHTHSNVLGCTELGLVMASSSIDPNWRTAAIGSPRPNRDNLPESDSTPRDTPNAVPPAVRIPFASTFHIAFRTT